MPAMLNYDIGVVLDDDNRGRHSAYAKVTGLTVYGGSEREAMAKLEDALDFFFQTIISRDGTKGMMDYLNRHEVVYEVAESGTENVLNLKQSVLVNV